MAVERATDCGRERAGVDRDLSVRRRHDLALAFEHTHQLIVRDPIRLLPRLARRGGRQRGRSDLHRGRADARGECGRELGRALGQRVAQARGDVDVAVQRADDRLGERVADLRAIEDRTHRADVGIGVEDERPHPQCDGGNQCEETRDPDEAHRRDASAAHDRRGYGEAQARTGTRAG